MLKNIHKFHHVGCNSQLSVETAEVCTTYNLAKVYACFMGSQHTMNNLAFHFFQGLYWHLQFIFFIIQVFMGSTNQVHGAIACFLLILEGVTPLESMSAGFSFPGQCVHELIGSSLQISFTLFWTKSFHSLSMLFIQYKATLESVKQVTPNNGTSDLIAAIVAVMSLANNNADNSSNHNMVCFPTGENLVFEITPL